MAPQAQAASIRGRPHAALPERRADGWEALHTTFCREAKEAGVLGRERCRVLFLGDSITEACRGTQYGEVYDELRPRRKVFEAQFTPLGARAFGISGDRTQNLLWRLQNGELQFRHAPDVVVVCIGTNNIGRDGDGAEDTFLGICAVCAEIQHRLPGSRILLPGILPRGPGLGSEDAASGGMIPGAPGTSADYQIAKDNGDKFAQPGVYTATIDEVNRRLRTFAENPVASGGLVHYVDCQGVFKTASKNGLEPSLMRDALHPTAKGMIAWYSVLAPAIAKLVAAASSAPAQQEHALRAKL